MAVVEVEPVTDENWPALEDLFGRGGASNGCWCMYWLLGPEYHRRPREQNKQALRKATGSDVSPGLLALDDDGRAVGWARLSPRSELDWLNQRRDLAPVDDLPVWHCRASTCAAGSTRNLFPGTLTAFERAGFVEVARRKQDRPIVRHLLG